MPKEFIVLIVAPILVGIATNYLLTGWIRKTTIKQVAFNSHGCGCNKRTKALPTDIGGAFVLLV